MSQKVSKNPLILSKGKLTNDSELQYREVSTPWETTFNYSFNKRTQDYEKDVIPVLGLLLLAGCEKEVSSPAVSEADQTIDLRGRMAKIDVCHYSADDNMWVVINIAENGWPGHEAHGDVRLDDEDDDGFVPYNECGIGNMGDCDDQNAAVNPGMEEKCNNGVDDDCDGDVDEADSDCESCDWVTVTLPDGSTLYVYSEDQRLGRPGSNGIDWGGNTTDVPGLDNISTFADALADFDGAANTQAIVAALGDGDYPAKICADLVCNGYDDWYLPALGELKAIYDKLGTDNLTGDLYWSSTEYNASSAFSYYFKFGSAALAPKNLDWLSCRCVRK